MTYKPWHNTPLNLEEFYEAIEEARKCKWFKERSKDYYKQLEEKKIKGKHVTNI